MSNRTYFTPEHDEFRLFVRRVLQERIVPYADEWETNREIPSSAFLHLGEAGLLGLYHDTSVGGSGKDIFYSVIFLEELGRLGYGGIRSAVAVHAYMATPYLSSFGSTYLKSEFLKPAISGERVAALAITEPQAGSDLSSVQTAMTADREHLVINGEKRFVANGRTADFFIAAVRADERAAAASERAPSMSLCVVERSARGVHVTPNRSVSWRSAGVADITFEAVRIPRENIIGRLNSGLMQIVRNMQLERLAAGILAVGETENCLDMTWRHLRSRDLFRTTLSKMQTVRHKMAELRTELEAARQLAYYSAWAFEQDPLSILECSMTKLKATELAKSAAEHCLHFHGADGYDETSAIYRIMRDTQATTIAAGPSEVMRDIIVQSAFDERAW